MTRGSQYWSAKEQIKWQELREQFAQKSLSLVRTRFGLNPTAPRPSTYLTWHFLQESVMQWLVALLLLLPFAWPLEAKLGWQRMIVLWFGSGVIAGMFYVLFMQSSYLPLIGATPITSALIGAYLGLFALQKMTFVWFHPKLKAWQKKELPAWLPAPLWLLLPLYEAFGGASAPHAWIALVAALLAGVGLAQLVRPHDIMGIDEEKEEETDTEKLQRQKLGSAWASMQALEFRDAERQFEASLKAGPGFAALTGLYQVRKLHPETAEFEDTALKVLRYQTSEIGEMRQQMHIYRDYIKRIIDLDKLPADTRTVLATHFCLIEEMREADRIAESLAEEKVVTDLSLRMYQTLADKFERFGQISKANHYAHQADKVKKALAASTQPLQGNA